MSAQNTASYHPHGYGVSPSLQRARKPFRYGNAIIGSCVALFAAGVYTYSISSVKQDDFSDVADLLPPESERAGIRTLEDEARDKNNTKMTAFQSIVSTLPSRQSLNSPSNPPQAVYQPSSPSAPFKSLPSESSTDGAVIAGQSGSLVEPSEGFWRTVMPRRLDQISWVRNRGLVEQDGGNVLVWGAPNVDIVGRMSETQGKQSRGPRLV